MSLLLWAQAAMASEGIEDPSLVVSSTNFFGGLSSVTFTLFDSEVIARIRSAEAGTENTKEGSSYAPNRVNMATLTGTFNLYSTVSGIRTGDTFYVDMVYDTFVRRNKRISAQGVLVAR